MSKKLEKYARLREQIRQLTDPVYNPLSTMSTICAVLHHKMPGFFWTGFYVLSPGPDSRLLVGPYQGPLACLELPRDKGVCWASVKRRGPVIVDDVHQFPGHIACNSQSRSEVVVPFWRGFELGGVLDVDSRELAHFDEEDARGLATILQLIYP